MQHSRTLDSEPDYDSIDSFFVNKHGENLEYAYNLLLRYMSDPDASMKITSSSGSSVVFLSDTVSVVIQVFGDKKLVERVFTFINSVAQKTCIINIDPNHEERYEIGKYLVPFELYFPENNTIIWKKILTLNSMKENIGSFIVDNYWKFIWDLSHGLQGIHSAGFAHGDCTIDNIGIYDGKFVLFDFDMSKPATPDSISKDFGTLSKSLQFHTNQKLTSGGISYVVFSAMNEMGINSVDNAIKYLNELEINIS